jgi:transposase-like protein
MVPIANPEEFRRRAVGLPRQPGSKIALTASDLGIPESCLHRWMKTDDVDAGRKRA